MAYTIEWSAGAAGQLEVLEKQVQERIRNRLAEAARNPEHYFERLSGSAECKLRAGDYRIVAFVFHNSKRIFIQRIGHRKGVYK